MPVTLATSLTPVRLLLSFTVSSYRFQFLELLFSSTVSKLVASSITYPHEVLRARLQDGRGVKYHAAPAEGAQTGKTVLSATATGAASATHCATARPAQLGIVAVLRDIVQKEGVLSLWSGLRVSMFRVVPATASSFLSYEYISHYLKEHTTL